MSSLNNLGQHFLESGKIIEKDGIKVLTEDEITGYVEEKVNNG